MRLTRIPSPFVSAPVRVLFGGFGMAVLVVGGGRSGGTRPRAAIADGSVGAFGGRGAGLEPPNFDIKLTPRGLFWLLIWILLDVQLLFLCINRTHPFDCRLGSFVIIQ